MTSAVELRDLSKSFDGVDVVHGIDAEVGTGRVTAFLGANGAGKTTTLRMVLGLIEPTSGSATFGGRRYRELPEPARHVGAVLEASGGHPGRTALDHLRSLAVAARLPTSAPMRALTETGLADHARRRVDQFSLGMRQRLGLAAALLGDPEVLVLDEPTNGLDPQGVRWLRAHLRRFADEGRTVLVSSHALGEVEHIADDVLVIANGRLVRSTTLADLRAEAGVSCRVRTPDPARLEAVLDAAGVTRRRIDHDIDDDLAVDATPELVGELAAANGVVLHHLAATTRLEDAFFLLTDHQSGAATT